MKITAFLLTLLSFIKTLRLSVTFNVLQVSALSFSYMHERVVPGGGVESKE